MKLKEGYSYVIVESYYPKKTSGLHGPIHIRPVPGQDPFLPDMHVRCPKELSYDYPVGTKFRVIGKVTTRKGGNPFVHTNNNWPYEVLKE